MADGARQAARLLRRVEEDESVASLVHRALMNHGIRPIWIRDGESAIHKLAGASPIVRAKVIVLEVDPASPAAERHVKAGDVVVEVAQEAVTSIEDIAKGIERVRTAGRNAVLLRLEDAKGDMRFVAVPIQ